MKADEAKKLTQENLKGPVIEPLLDGIYRQIEAAAKKGRSSITHPCRDKRMPYPSSDEQEAVWTHLRAEGYKVTHHADPAPGHPASSAYDEISWGQRLRQLAGFIRLSSLICSLPIYG